MGKAAQPPRLSAACSVLPLGTGARGEGCGVWLRLTLVFFPFGGLGCLLSLRRPPETSGLENEVDAPPPQEPAVPWGLAQPLAHRPMQIRDGNLQLDN